MVDIRIKHKMDISISPDHTVTLTVDKAELGSINDALDTRVHLAVMARCKADTLSVGDEQTARELERATYEAYCQLEDQIREAKEPAAGHASEMGNMLFGLLTDMNRAYAKAVR
jgi:hypothetical protein